ncbi:hypothetical protein BXY85_1578 [Roseivirga pacifica]|uniref:Viral A-type inclusion protein n=1 Tax=Roseivirga pacifica TaxID=1267423 RepID=A0A1I0MNG5_9BACT|nr:hypothetical protein [Roseivirga pacifica]RKQ50562.1 hypothetical protein BXY85_1578 [Roseivirga pacifica]SEV89999.1 hypothetical protein SAMN05216290_0562 [Roseivirga pacifica]
MKKVLAVLAIFVFAVACGESYNTQEHIDKVFNVHDEVMPKMGEVMALKRQVLEKASALEEANGDSTKVAELKDIADKLETANDGMMKWMRAWQANAQPHINEQTTVEERKAFLNSEMEKVEKVREDINSSIEAAKSVLK